jgi:hypothetical protein
MIKIRRNFGSPGRYRGSPVPRGLRDPRGVTSDWERSRRPDGIGIGSRTQLIARFAHDHLGPPATDPMGPGTLAASDPRDPGRRLTTQSIGERPGGRNDRPVVRVHSPHKPDTRCRVFGWRPIPTQKSQQIAYVRLPPAGDLDLFRRIVEIQDPSSRPETRKATPPQGHVGRLVGLRDGTVRLGDRPRPPAPIGRLIVMPNWQVRSAVRGKYLDGALDCGDYVAALGSRTARAGGDPECIRAQ